jgi:uncharacterized protein (TIGR02246 family)
MNRVIPLVFTWLLVCGSASAQTEADKKEILRSFDSWNQGWAYRDADLAVQDYADDTDWTNAFGARFQGKKALRDGLEYIFSLDFVMAGDSAGNEYEDITFLSPDIAIVRSKLVRSGQKTSTGEAMPDRNINHLRVFQKRDGRWLIVSHLISDAKERR